MALIWTTAFVILTAFGVEWYLSGGDRYRHAPYYSQLHQAYNAFRIQHLNPFYMFFFPLERDARTALGNDVVSIDADGFRGRGPSYAEGRKLAFFLGGSSAFGWYSSSNGTTITGYLNAMQDEYHFVNAGVPSWNTTQELFRTVHQVLKFNPDLIITYDGANDAAILNSYATWGFAYPAGTPETFETLHLMVDDLRSGGRSGFHLHERLFPKIVRGIRKIGWKSRVSIDYAGEEVIERGVAAYVHNLQVIHDVMAGRGKRFIGVFQPIRSMHENIPQEHVNRRRLPTYQKFHELAMNRYRPEFEFHDYSNFFDQHFEKIPSIDTDIGMEVTKSTVFVDEVHLHDAGYRLVAQAIHSIVRR